MMRIEQAVYYNLVHRCDVSQSDRIIVALSGGADSVCLLRLLLSLGFSDIIAVHCNFHLRGDESNRDEAFVRGLCRSLNVELVVTDFDTLLYANANHVSIEMAARDLRYEWFESLLKKKSASCIAVAHHEDDVAETVLLNLVRGTGIQGVSGIAFRNRNIVRPLLSLSRSQILNYLNSIVQDYVTDSTNLEDDCKRNILRLNVMPELRRLNPSASHSVAVSARHLSDVARIYEEAIAGAMARVMDGDSVSISKLCRETAPCTLLYECLRQYGFSSAAVEDFYGSITDGESGRILENENWRVLQNRDQLIIEPALEPSRIHLELNDFVDCSFSDYSSDFEISRLKSVATLDAELVDLPLSIRRVSRGDRFFPFGMRGSKLLSDYMTDRKFSLFQKERQLVVTDASNRIVWLVGERSDNRFRVTYATRKVIVLQEKS